MWSFQCSLCVTSSCSVDSDVVVVVAVVVDAVIFPFLLLYVVLFPVPGRDFSGSACVRQRLCVNV